MKMSAEDQNKHYHIRNKTGKLVEPYRKIIEDHIGRELQTDEVIHHINGNHYDNRLENLMILDSSTHGKLHAAQRIKDSKRIKKIISIDKNTLDKGIVLSNKMFSGNFSMYITFLINKDCENQ